MLFAFSCCSAEYGGKEIGPSVNTKLCLRIVMSSFRIVSLEMSRITRYTEKMLNLILEQEKKEGELEKKQLRILVIITMTMLNTEAV